MPVHRKMMKLRLKLKTPRNLSKQAMAARNAAAVDIGDTIIQTGHMKGLVNIRINGDTVADTLRSNMD